MTAGFIHEARSQIAVKRVLDLNDALAMSSRLGATDMRDKVYGVLGMSFHNETPDLLSIDYHKPWQHVLRDAVKYIILNSNPSAASPAGLPFILRWISYRNENDIHSTGFSSWVPRLDREPDTALEDRSLLKHGVWELPDNKVVVAKSSADPRAILLQGMKVDVIQTVLPVLEASMTRDKDALKSYFNTLVKAVQDNGLAMDTLARTLIADTNLRNKRSTSDDTVGLAGMLETIEKKAAIASLSNLSVENMEQPSSAITFYREAFWQASRNHRVAFLNGGRVALCPRTCQSGDIIVALYCDAGGFLYVLRPDSEGYRLVGACYVDGCMPWQDSVGVRNTTASEWFEIF